MGVAGGGGRWLDEEVGCGWGGVAGGWRGYGGRWRGLRCGCGCVGIGCKGVGHGWRGVGAMDCGIWLESEWEVTGNG